MPFSSKIKNAVNRKEGETFWRKWTITSSNILTTAQNLSPAAAGGELAITQVILQTDATGLAGGTNFQLQTSNAKGVAVFVAETVAHLGANATYSMFPYQGGTNKYQFSVTGVPTVLTRGQTIQFLNTGGVGTGAGTVDVYVRFERLNDGSQLASVSSGVA